MKCEQCAASVVPGASWCGQCYAPVARLPTAPPVHGWRPQIGAEPMRSTRTIRTSRTRAGVSSFGIVGRSLFTLVWLLVLAVVVYSGALIAIFVWVVLVGPMWMREVWKPTPVS